MTFENADNNQLASIDKLIDAGNISEATNILQSIAQDELRSAVLVREIKIYLLEDKIAEAKVLFENARDVIEDDHEVLKLQLRLMVAQKDINAAFELCTSNLNSFKGDIEFRVIHAAILRVIGQLDQSVRELEYVLQQQPNNSDALMHLGLNQLQRNEINKAEATLVNVVKLKPSNIKLKILLVKTYISLGKFDQAQHLLETTKLETSEGWYLKGICFIHQVATGEAKYAFENAVNLNAGNVEAWYNLGLCCQMLNEVEGAIDCYQKVTSLDDYHFKALNNLGVLYKNLEQLEISEKILTRAVNIEPNFLASSINLASVLRMKGEVHSAVKLYKKLDIQSPNQPEIINNLGNALVEIGELDAAIKCFHSALEVSNLNSEIYSNLGHAYRNLGEYDNALKYYGHAVEIDSENMVSHSNLLFGMASSPLFNPSDYLKHAESYGLKTRDQRNFKYTHNRDFTTHKRLKIGFVSADLHNHPVAYFVENLFINIDKQRFEICVFSNSKVRTDQTEVLEKLSCSWYSIRELSDEAAAKLIFDNQIDVLIDLSGHTAHNRLPVFAYKPAPIQATWLGYFATTGVDEIDFIIGDEVVLPSSLQEFYTEQISHLDGIYVCFSPPEAADAISPTPALKNGYFSFGCFNKSDKVNNDVIETWAKILLNVKDSQLIFKGRTYLGETQERIANCFSFFGVGRERLKFLDHSNRSSHLASYNEIDIALDPFPYPGATTTCEGLWMGVPTVTLKGNGTFLSNVGETIAKFSEHEEYCVPDRQEYVEKVVSLTHDVNKLNYSRLARREHLLNTQLFDGKQFAKNFETLILQVITKTMH